MRLKTLILFAIILIVKNVQGQKGANYAKIGLGFSKLINEGGTYGFKTGFNALATDYIGVSNKGSVALTAAYNSFTANNLTSFQASFLHTTIGYREFVKSNFYFQPHIGLAFSTGEYSKGKNTIAYGIAFGNVFGKKNKTGLDAMLRLEGNSSSKKWIGLTIGYQFKVK